MRLRSTVAPALPTRAIQTRHRRILWSCLLLGFLLLVGSKTYFGCKQGFCPPPAAVASAEYPSPRSADARHELTAGNTPRTNAAPFLIKIYVFSRTQSAYDMDLNVFGMRVAAQILGFFDPFHVYWVEEVCQGDPLPPARPGVIVVTHEYFQTIDGSYQDTGLILVPDSLQGAAHLNATGRFYVAPPGTIESIYGAANVFFCGKLGPGTLGTFGIMRTLVSRSCADHLVWHPFWRR